MIESAKILTAWHRESGLWMARSDDLPGFILHAHDEAGLRERLEPALKEYLEILHNAPIKMLSLTDENPSFVPPTFIARSELAIAA